MSPRILRAKSCPHCRAELPQPTPRVCPQCGGSLQKRFLTVGCLTSAPPIVLAIATLGFGAHAAKARGGEAATSATRAADAVDRAHELPSSDAAAREPLGARDVRRGDT